MASPGGYEVRLFVDGQVLSQSFKILPDPRINGKLSAADLKAQETLALQVVALEDSSKRIAEKIKMKRKELEPLLKEGKATEAQVKVDQRLNDLQKMLVTKEGPYQRPVLIDQLNYLRGTLDQSDQRPGKDALDRFDELKEMAEKVFREFQDMTEKSGL